MRGRRKGEAKDQPMVVRPAQPYGVMVKVPHGWGWITPSGAATLQTVLAARWPDELSALEAATTLSTRNPSGIYRTGRLVGRG
jgi:hypothetical protein